VNVLFVTGAGISANAGIATYRDGGSSWKDKDLEAKSHANRYGNHLDELWDKHWGPQQAAMRAAKPTYTHDAIARFQQTHDAIVATQNIDDLHERAGSDNIAHVHGVMNAKCMRCKSDLVTEWNGNGAPRCINCQSRKIRPDVVLFGEMLSFKLMKGLNTFAYTADHIISVGTSLNVFPVAGLVMDHIEKAIIINKDATPFDKWARAVYHEDCDVVIDEVLAGLDSTVNV
jgi:NAD-dependent deacetylase